MNDNILSIIASGESEEVEFKASFSKDVIETLCAFANNRGGTVLVGVEDSGKIVGVTCGPETVQTWMNQTKQSTMPSIIPNVELAMLDGKQVVVIHVNEFPVKPVACRDRYYKRVLNSNHRLSVVEIANLHLQSLQLSWDSYPTERTTLSDLDTDKIRIFIERVKEGGRFRGDRDWQAVLEKLGFLQQNRPARAAILLFGKDDPPYAVHIGRFKTPSIIIDDRMIRGTLFEVVEESMRFILSHLKVAFEITGESKRLEIFEYPLPALRELLLNAVVHRDYTSPVDTQIKIFDNSISFFNPGKLFGDLTIEKLKRDDYQSRTRNKLIAEAFYLTRDIEKYGSGFIRVRDEITTYPSMVFSYQESGDGFLVLLEYQHQKISSFSTHEGINEGINVPVNVPANVPANVPVNIRQQWFLDQLRQGISCRSTDIAEKWGVVEKTAKRDISDLQKKNLIVFVGPAKTGSYQLK